MSINWDGTPNVPPGGGGPTGGATFRVEFETGRAPVEEAQRAADQFSRIMQRFTIQQISAIETFGKFSFRIDSFIKKILDVAQSFEVLRAKLSTVIGNMQEVDEALNRSVRYASKTPFSVEEIVNARTQLAIYGQDVEKWTEISGDIASTMGQPIAHVANAIGKAFEGSTLGVRVLTNSLGISREQLRMYGATVNAQGGVLLRTKEQVESFKLAIESIHAERFAGGMEFRMQTMGGAFQNLEDASMNLLRSLGDSISGLAIVFAKISTWFIDLSRWFLSFDVGSGLAKIGLITAALIGVGATIGLLRSQTSLLLVNISNIFNLTYTTAANAVIPLSQAFADASVTQVGFWTMLKSTIGGVLRTLAQFPGYLAIAAIAISAAHLWSVYEEDQRYNKIQELRLKQQENQARMAKMRVERILGTNANLQSLKPTQFGPESDTGITSKDLTTYTYEHYRERILNFEKKYNYELDSLNEERNKNENNSDAIQRQIRDRQIIRRISDLAKIKDINNKEIALERLKNIEFIARIKDNQIDESDYARAYRASTMFAGNFNIAVPNAEKAASAIEKLSNSSKEFQIVRDSLTKPIRNVYPEKLEEGEAKKASSTFNKETGQYEVNPDFTPVIAGQVTKNTIKDLSEKMSLINELEQNGNVNASEKLILIQDQFRYQSMIAAASSDTFDDQQLQQQFDNLRMKTLHDIYEAQNKIIGQQKEQIMHLASIGKLSSANSDDALKNADALMRQAQASANSPVYAISSKFITQIKNKQQEELKEFVNSAANPTRNFNAILSGLRNTINKKEGEVEKGKERSFKENLQDQEHLQEEGFSHSETFDKLFSDFSGMEPKGLVSLESHMQNKYGITLPESYKKNLLRSQKINEILTPEEINDLKKAYLSKNLDEFDDLANKLSRKVNLSSGSIQQRIKENIANEGTQDAKKPENQEIQLKTAEQLKKQKESNEKELQQWVDVLKTGYGKVGKQYEKFFGFNEYMKQTNQSSLQQQVKEAEKNFETVVSFMSGDSNKVEKARADMYAKIYELDRSYRERRLFLLNDMVSQETKNSHGSTQIALIALNQKLALLNQEKVKTKEVLEEIFKTRREIGDREYDYEKTKFDRMQELQDRASSFESKKLNANPFRTLDDTLADLKRQSEFAEKQQTEKFDRFTEKTQSDAREAQIRTEEGYFSQAQEEAARRRASLPSLIDSSEKTRIGMEDRANQFNPQINKAMESLQAARKKTQEDLRNAQKNGTTAQEFYQSQLGRLDSGAMEEAYKRVQLLRQMQAEAMRGSKAAGVERDRASQELENMNGVVAALDVGKKAQQALQKTSSSLSVDQVLRAQYDAVGASIAKATNEFLKGKNANDKDVQKALKENPFINGLRGRRAELEQLMKSGAANPKIDRERYNLEVDKEGTRKKDEIDQKTKELLEITAINESIKLHGELLKLREDIASVDLEKSLEKYNRAFYQTLNTSRRYLKDLYPAERQSDEALQSDIIRNSQTRLQLAIQNLDLEYSKRHENVRTGSEEEKILMAEKAQKVREAQQKELDNVIKIIDIEKQKRIDAIKEIYAIMEKFDKQRMGGENSPLYTAEEGEQIEAARRKAMGFEQFGFKRFTTGTFGLEGYDPNADQTKKRNATDLLESYARTLTSNMQTIERSLSDVKDGFVGAVDRLGSLITSTFSGNGLKNTVAPGAAAAPGTATGVSGAAAPSAGAASTQFNPGLPGIPAGLKPNEVYDYLNAKDKVNEFIQNNAKAVPKPVGMGFPSTSVEPLKPASVKTGESQQVASNTQQTYIINGQNIPMTPVLEDLGRSAARAVAFHAPGSEWGLT